MAEWQTAWHLTRRQVRQRLGWFQAVCKGLTIMISRLKETRKYENVLHDCYKLVEYKMLYNIVFFSTNSMDLMVFCTYLEPIQSLILMQIRLVNMTLSSMQVITFVIFKAIRIIISLYTLRINLVFFC